jgi:hypothetical protein
MVDRYIALSLIIARFARVLPEHKEILESNAKHYSVLKTQIVIQENLVSKINALMYVGWMEYVETMQSVQPLTTLHYVPVMQGTLETPLLDARGFSNAQFKMIVLIT